MEKILLIAVSFLGFNLVAQDTIVEKSTTYHVVSQPTTYEETINPKYNGGEEAMNKFITETIRYPESAKLSGQHGKVYVAFKVKEDGSLIDVEITRGVSPLLDEEALRVVKAMPAWIPGTKGGKNATMRYYIPVEFKAK